MACSGREKKSLFKTQMIDAIHLFFRLPYNEFFGGVSGLTVEQFRKINGFPNAFWGWGGEDDDLWNRYPLLLSSRDAILDSPDQHRLINALRLSRPVPSNSNYGVLSHVCNFQCFLPHFKRLERKKVQFIIILINSFNSCICHSISKIMPFQHVFVRDILHSFFSY